MSEFLRALFTRGDRNDGGGALWRALPAASQDERNWGADADWAHLDQQPLRARALLRWAALVVVALVVWAAYARIDEVTKGQGRVIPSSQLQVVQAVDGGVVEELLVAEGQTVEAGQVLVRIDPTRFVSSLRENRAELLALQARAARLTALSDARPFEPAQALRDEIPEIVAQERAHYQSSLAGLEAQLGIARQQLTQRNEELREATGARASAARSLELTDRELAVTKPLASAGAVSEVELLRLERDVNRFRGERDQADAQISRLRAAIREANQKIQDVELSFRNQVRKELSEVSAKLGTLSEGSLALEDRVKHAEVRAPVRGTVKRLLVNTVGGVVQPGAEVVEVVPLDDALVLETKISPRDIAFLRPRQPATVKFTAYDFAIYGGLDAELDQIAADSVIDEEGNAFFVVKVRTLKNSLGEGLPIIPGMVAEVDILTGKKSILDYLLKPVLRAKANALTER
ncbi:MAG: HlyD family type I secretion periplasmic adaptor subunit [Zoogloeaceae bacterium]|nr:HlyD family type I secretion periplasmic adaptor subunit [Rhodocyclaceae bacterium]MCP5234743.1 HlyD family type I secretion periplasmic adaptor subunit [Zoogloeaceae bacterium]